MRVLLVEDALDLATGVINRLARSGVVCDLAKSLDEAQDYQAVQNYDALVLDINLPDGSGLALLRDLRASGDRTPVLMLTALGSVEDRVHALDLGADDYLTKPFDQRELEARLRALIRREAEQKGDHVMLGDLAFFPSGQAATLAGRRLELTRREAALLETLLRFQGQYVSKTRLYDSLFAFDSTDVGVNAVELYIARLRKKLVTSTVTITTQRGIGYRIDADG